MHTAPTHTAAHPAAYCTVRQDGAYRWQRWDSTPAWAMTQAITHHDPFQREVDVELCDVWASLPRERKDRATTVPVLDVEALTLEPACVALEDGHRVGVWEDDTDAEAMEQALWDLDVFQARYEQRRCMPAAYVGLVLAWDGYDA